MHRFFMTFLALLFCLVASPASAGGIQDYIFAKCKDEYGKSRGGEKAKFYAPLIEKMATKHHLSSSMLAALIWHESNYDPNEISPCGALGLGQIMPMHWSARNGHPLSAWRDPATNLDLTCVMLKLYRREMEYRYPGLPDAALWHRTLVSYNMGPGGVSRGIYRSGYSRAILGDAFKIGR